MPLKLTTLVILAIPLFSFAQDDQRQFAGLNFGVGISLTLDTGSNSRIDAAQIIQSTENGVTSSIVRVDKESNDRARIMLESHYFFTPNNKFLGRDSGAWGIGPFIALQPGTDEIIETIGGGVMIGFKRPDSSGSWNLGLGYAVDPRVQILGDGFVENEAPPAGETAVRFKETSQGGVLLITSFSF